MALTLYDPQVYTPKRLNEVLLDWVDEVEFDGEMSVDEKEEIFSVTHKSFPINGNDFEVHVQCNEPSELFAVAMTLLMEFPSSLDGAVLEKINDANSTTYCGHFEKVGKYIRFRHCIDVEKALPTGALLTNAIRAGMAAFSSDFVAELEALGQS